MPPKLKTSGLAIAALVFAIIPGCQLVGLILGVIALVQIGNRPNELGGKGIAIAALVVPWVMIFFTGIFAAIAIPNFIRYESRAKQSEAKTNLRMIYIAEQSYEAEHNKPAENFADLDFRPEAKHRYAYFMHGDVIPASVGFVPPTFHPQGERSDVLATAVANLDTDPTLDVWIVTTGGEVIQLKDDITE
ncbi:MAG: DUF4190 domain-containing protein [Deltaproteobacteria bacterium]|nr:DUF4190 domain-containing protein [Deltaproteobacteria bacterium]